MEICLKNNALLVCLVALKHGLSDFSYYLLILKACEKSPQINFAVINKSPGVVNCRYQHGKREEYKLSLLQEMQGELTAATLKSLTIVLCHEDYKVLRRHSRQGLVDPRADGLGSRTFGVRLGSIRFLFGFVRLDRSGV